MIVYKGIEIVEIPPFLLTNGLREKGFLEFRIIKINQTEANYLRLLSYLIDYVLIENPQILDKETIAYHSWILQVRENSGYFDLWEASSNGSGFIKGVDYTLYMVNSQETECKNRGLTPVFPTFSQKIVISKGVYEGCSVEAVRYPSPIHMTGWWLTTEQYNDDINSLMTVHYYHVVFKRPDIVKYLALPFGYRFYLEPETTEIWFDNEVLM